MGRQPCDACRRAFTPTKWDTPAERDRKKNGPPCATCRPGVHPRNALAYALYQRCADQLIIAPMGGVVGLNTLAVKCTMELMRIPFLEQDDLMLQVQELAGLIIGERAREAERRREENK